MDEQVQDIVIVGAGGLGREVKWLIDRINAAQETWHILGFYDDAVTSMPPKYPPILGRITSLMTLKRSLGVVLALGDSTVRRAVHERIKANDQLFYPSLFDPDSVIADSACLGKGLVVFALSIITSDVTIGDHVHVNQCCSIGHDVVIGEFCTLYPCSVISGSVTIGKECEFGANSCILQGLEIANRVSIGAGAVVTKDVEEENVTLVGVPARKILTLPLFECK